MIALIARSRLRQLEADVAELRRQTWLLSHQVAAERSERALVRQALEKAEQDAAYWKTRAERFLDQIAFQQGMISMPTMTEPEAPAGSDVDTVFSALGINELPNDKSPAAGAAPAAPSVTGVDGAAAQAAINEVLAATR